MNAFAKAFAVGWAKLGVDPQRGENFSKKPGTMQWFEDHGDALKMILEASEGRIFRMVPSYIACNDDQYEVLAVACELLSMKLDGLSMLPM